MTNKAENNEQEAPDTSEVEIEIEADAAQPDQEEDAGESAEQEEEFDHTKRVDFDKPEQQRKFNDVYKQMKMSDQRNKFLTDINTKLMAKLEGIESRFAQTDTAEAERTLEARLKEARDNGDDVQEAKIWKEIIDFRVESKLSAVTKKPETVAQADISDPLVQDVIYYATETDDKGQILRPWIADVTHPQHKQAMSLAGFIATKVNAEVGYVDGSKVMEELDKAMRAKPATAQPQPRGNTRAPDPMRGNLTNNQPKSKIKLSQAELAMANKLGVKPEAYAKWKPTAR